VSHRWYQSHEWKTVGSHCGVGLSSIAEGSTERLITIVLYRCACGKHKTKTLNGHWTMDKLASPESGEESGG
jgi:hypothetical protein